MVAGKRWAGRWSNTECTLDVRSAREASMTLEDLIHTLRVTLIIADDVLGLTSLLVTTVLDGASALVLAEGVSELVDAELVTWPEGLVIASGADGDEWIVALEVAGVGSAGEHPGVAGDAL